MVQRHVVQSTMYVARAEVVVEFAVTDAELLSQPVTRVIRFKGRFRFPGGRRLELGWIGTTRSALSPSRFLR